ncbi:thioredoxin-like 3-2, chloroplastic isoform X2 [Gastrolobium bilobum]|uniref:thioredoxin-like 3-2, chloroplastic isoform X2 n=1 Tax=Gastrolobium bilobum TaxID=150636 RepID=UPI002AAF11E1|nr:thioredoxin-like 3-2, chloroplastic isoform X2 [Gastrolobium bilobum]
MSQHLSIHTAPFSLKSPTTKSKSLSLCCFRSSFPFPNSPLISISCDCANETPSIGGAIPLRQQGFLEDDPVFLHIQPILSETHFDRVVAEAQQLRHSLLIVWMATWCRKCIYLKPKLEKLAEDYYPRLRFYSVDVNTVPHKLVARAGVTLWKDGKKQAEVIGGHKAYLVINEVQEMIENECNM